MPIPAMPQIFTVNSKPISSTSISSVNGSLSNTIDISELLEDSQNTERGFFSNSKMGQITKTLSLKISGYIVRSFASLIRATSDFIVLVDHFQHNIIHRNASQL